MDGDVIIARVERFERTVATCLCVVPLLFATQCFFAAIAAPVFKEMFVDFGSKLPWLTVLMFRIWPVLATFAAIVPVIAVVVARKAGSNKSVVFSTAAGVVMFVVAQVVTLALFLPIWQLGAVAGGAK